MAWWSSLRGPMRLKRSWRRPEALVFDPWRGTSVLCQGLGARARGRRVSLSTESSSLCWLRSSVCIWSGSICCRGRFTFSWRGGRSRVERALLLVATMSHLLCSLLPSYGSIPLAGGSDRIILLGSFHELDEVFSEVPEDSRVLRVRRLWFPTSDRLQTWLIPSGTTVNQSRQFHESTIVWRNLPPHDRFWYFVLSFSSKRAWQSGNKHYQRWDEGTLRQTMIDSWYCLDHIVPERMSQVLRRSDVGNHKRRTVLRWALLSNGYFVHFLTLCL